MVPNMLLLAAAIATAPAAATPRCAADARTQALKLLRFHVDGDDRAAIDPASLRKIGTVGSLVHKRRFDVLQISGYVYKGAYRIRLIYAPLPRGCLLMGQEIFERGDPY